MSSFEIFRTKIKHIYAADECQVVIAILVIPFGTPFRCCGNEATEFEFLPSDRGQFPFEYRRSAGRRTVTHLPLNNETERQTAGAQRQRESCEVEGRCGRERGHQAGPRRRGASGEERKGRDAYPHTDPARARTHVRRVCAFFLRACACACVCVRARARCVRAFEFC